MLSFNLEGFRRNQNYLSHLLSNRQPRVLFLQEIWIPYRDKRMLESFHPDYSFCISTPDMFSNPEDLLLRQAHVWHGVAVGWRNDIAASITPLDSTCERISGVKFTLQNHSLLLVSYYAPTAGKDEEFLESVCDLSDFLLKHLSRADQVVIGADCNCSQHSSKRRQEAWRNFHERFHLSDHRSSHPSFHHHNGLSETYLDSFSVSSSLNFQSISQYCTLEEAMNLSSHDPIVSGTRIQLDIRDQCSNKYSNTYTEFNRQKIIWDKAKLPEYERLASGALSDALNFWNSPESIPLLSSLTSRLLVTCASLVFESKPSARLCFIKKPSLRIRQAINVMKRAFTAWKYAGKPNSKLDPARAEYCEARSNLQILRRQGEHLSNIKDNNYLMHLNRSNKSKIFNFMKKKLGHNSKAMTTILHTPVGTYRDEDVLEGFAADTEHLGRSNENNKQFDQGFYTLCKLDNLYIFDFLCDEPLQIPPMSISDLNHILYTKMKPGKACDVYHVTVEHLRHCGNQAKLHILALVNRILANLYYLSCPQIKLGLGSAVHKGKKKPLSRSNSYRRITVSPILGALIDYYLDPKAEALFRPHQSPDQLGFTAGVSYLLASIQRGECQRWALDQKTTCFGVSLDGEAAFPSVEREIQVRELYSIGERGDILQYSRSTYKNTTCHIKVQDKLSRKVIEHKGNRQGHVRASGHYKVYVNPALLSLNTPGLGLGFQLGPLVITVVCVADDAYLLSSSPSGLQAVLDIMSHYARRYQLQFNAGKTKIVVTGSKIDMAFYKDTKPWSLNGEKISVVDSNEHLGLIVAGADEEQKNVDENITKCRSSLFTLLGPAFAYKCLLSPTVQLHIWRTCSLPVLLSGLPALPIRPSVAKSLQLFHNKIMRGVLKLSKSSPIPALHFLLGELPVEGVLHIRTLCLLQNIWSNPSLTIFSMVTYILKMCDRNSSTWSHHVQLLCQQYGLPSPLSLLQSTPPASKSSWGTLVRTRVTAWHEKRLRDKAEDNSKMIYLNVSLSGLSGRPHPVLHNIQTTQDVKKLRIHLKFLTCDFLTNDRLAKDKPGISAICDLCLKSRDTIEHILTSCSKTSEVRQRLYPELVNTVAHVQPTCSILLSYPSPSILTQFILDCSSLNLPSSYRIPAHSPDIFKICKISRDWCYAISCERSRLLKQLRVK